MFVWSNKNVSNNYKQDLIFFQAFSEKEKEKLPSQSYLRWFAWGQIALALISKHLKKKTTKTHKD